ncbi:hypothetical protein [Paenibacillus tarimensis]|nr:hypothetical protein [Paenibacillus tarimensis]MCF2943215.1 hypothetical protein [Paenibacillus tarimensis]
MTVQRDSDHRSLSFLCLVVLVGTLALQAIMVMDYTDSEAGKPLTAHSF